MKKNNCLVIALLITLLVSLMLVSAASAHNSGHIILPDGSCLNVGSLEEAPTVGAGNPNQLPNGQLDLIPGSGDHRLLCCDDSGSPTRTRDRHCRARHLAG